MDTTQTFPSPAAHRLGRVLHRLHERLMALLQRTRASAPAHRHEDALDPQDLLHEPHGFDRADEYRRQAVDKVRAACPYMRM